VVAGPMHSSTITRSILRLIASLSSSAASAGVARPLGGRQSARNRRIPDQGGRHCQGQPGLAHGKPAVIGRQNRLRLPGQFATPERYKKRSLKSGTTSSNPPQQRLRHRITASARWLLNRYQAHAGSHAQGPATSTSQSRNTGTRRARSMMVSLARGRRLASRPVRNTSAWKKTRL